LKIIVQLQDEHEYTNEEEQKLVQSLSQTAAQATGVEEGEVSLTIVSADEIRALNAQHRNLDRETDVLSFPLFDREELFTDGEWILPSEPDGSKPVLGDIVISYPRAVEQARQYGHSVQRELGFLYTHGFLHLVGYDHDSTEQEREMFTLQEDILSQHRLVR
jgi:probable rRNA maturation factor